MNPPYWPCLHFLKTFQFLMKVFRFESFAFANTEFNTHGTHVNSKFIKCMRLNCGDDTFWMTHFINIFCSTENGYDICVNQFMSIFQCLIWKYFMIASLYIFHTYTKHIHKTHTHMQKWLNFWRKENPNFDHRNQESSFYFDKKEKELTFLSVSINILDNFMIFSNRSHRFALVRAHTYIQNQK